jgi:hypothetical protein
MRKATINLNQESQKRTNPGIFKIQSTNFFNHSNVAFSVFHCKNKPTGKWWMLKQYYSFCSLLLYKGSKCSISQLSNLQINAVRYKVVTALLWNLCNYVNNWHGIITKKVSIFTISWVWAFADHNYCSLSSCKNMHNQSDGYHVLQQILKKLLSGILNNPIRIF